MKLISVFTYNLFIQLYGISIAIASLWNRKAALWIKGRKHWKSNLVKYQFTKQHRFWIHCASLGEFEQARPLIESLKSGFDCNIILTFFSPSGFEVRKDYQLADAVFYLPLDTPANACYFIEKVKPTAVFFTKYDFWYNYLNTLHSNSISCILFSARFHRSQIFFKCYGTLFREMLSYFSMIFVQNENSKTLLTSIGVKSIIAGDTRFDRVLQIARSKSDFPALAHFVEQSNVFIAGSTWPADDDCVVNLINSNTLSNFKFIIAPHDIDSQRIEILQKRIHLASIKWSELHLNTSSGYKVLIVDTVGHLSSVYAYCHIAYVGGGFDDGIHNILEPAVYGLPVIFGPHYRKNVEAEEMLAIGGAKSLSHPAEFIKVINELATDNILCQEMGEAAAEYVLSKTGGTDTILLHAVSLLKHE